MFKCQKFNPLFRADEMFLKGISVVPFGEEFD